MSTMYRQVVIEGVDELLKSEPEAGAFLIEAKTKINTGFFSQNYLDSIFQHWKGVVDIYDAYMFAQIHAMIGTGALARVSIGVGEIPLGDKAKQENNKRLSHLHELFEAEFYGGSGYGADGYLRWSGDIRMELTPTNAPTSIIEVRAGEAQLEVGYQRVEKTYFQLMESRFLARWPYGSKDITLFYLVKLPKSTSDEWKKREMIYFSI